MSNRGERKDDKPPQDYKGSGVVDKIADFILGEGLAKKAKEAIEKRKREHEDT